MIFDGRQPLIVDDLWWKTTFDGKIPLMKDNLWWKTTFDQRKTLMKDDLRWKTTFYERWLLMEDLWWKRTLIFFLVSMLRQYRRRPRLFLSLNLERRLHLFLFLGLSFCLSLLSILETSWHCEEGGTQVTISETYNMSGTLSYIPLNVSFHSVMPV